MNKSQIFSVFSDFWTVLCYVCIHVYIIHYVSHDFLAWLLFRKPKHDTRQHTGAFSSQLANECVCSLLLLMNFVTSDHHTLRVILHSSTCRKGALFGTT